MPDECPVLYGLYVRNRLPTAGSAQRADGHARPHAAREKPPRYLRKKRPRIRQLLRKVRIHHMIEIVHRERLLLCPLTAFLERV